MGIIKQIVAISYKYTYPETLVDGGLQLQSLFLALGWPHPSSLCQYILRTDGWVRESHFTFLPKYDGRVQLSNGFDERSQTVQPNSGKYTLSTNNETEKDIFTAK